MRCVPLAVFMVTSALLACPSAADMNVEAVEAALARSPALVRHHRGYMAYLAAHPELSHVEADYARYLDAHRHYATDARAVEAALQQDPEARRAFDAFYDQLAADGNLLHALEAFYRAEKRLLDGLTDNAGMATNPMQWLSLLGAETDAAALPEAMISRIAQAPAAMDALGNNLQTLINNDSIATWWARLNAFDAASQGAYGRLAAHFLEDPEAFTVWHARQLRLTEHPDARPWFRWWQVRIGEEENGVLAAAYDQYLTTLLEDTERANTAEQRWRDAYGPPLPWPPRQNPPGLMMHPQDGHSTVERRESHGGDRTKVRVPTMPQKPAVPSRPEMPRRPVKPTP